RGGTNEALVWQMARADKPDQPALRYGQLMSRVVLISSLGDLIGPALGGVFGNFLQVLPFCATAGIRLLGLLPLFLLREAPIQREPSARLNPAIHLRKSFQIVWHDPFLPGLLLVSALTSGSWHVIFFFIQLYLQGFGFPLPTIGFIVAMGSLSYLLFTAS